MWVVILLQNQLINSWPARPPRISQLRKQRRSWCAPAAPEEAFARTAVVYLQYSFPSPLLELPIGAARVPFEHVRIERFNYLGRRLNFGVVWDTLLFIVYSENLRRAIDPHYDALTVLWCVVSNGHRIGGVWWASVGVRKSP